MERKLKVINLDVSLEDLQSGVSFVALVGDPATQSNFLTFAENKPLKFEIQNEEKRIVTGVLMLADTEIYRNDLHGEYLIKFSKSSIFNMVRKFFRDGNTGNVNKMHDPAKPVNDVYMIESFIIDTERMAKPKGFENVPDGSWFGSYKVDNEDVWNEIKSGTFKGFSIEGNFIEQMFSVSKEERILAEIEKILNS